MNNNDQINNIKRVISEKTGLEIKEIHDNSFFEDDLNIGELELLEILAELEELFHVDLIEDKENIETVQDLTELITEQIE